MSIRKKSTLSIWLPLLNFMITIQHMYAGEITTIQELPVELIIKIAQSTINSNGKTHKEIFGSAITLLSQNRQLNSLKTLFLNTKEIKELRNKIDWEWADKKIKDYEGKDRIDNWIHNNASPWPCLYENINALHRAVDHRDLSF